MQKYNELIAQAVGAKKQVAKSLDATILSHNQHTKRLLHLEKAQAFLQKVAQDTQEQLKLHIEDIVQLALDAIFPDKYSFKVQFDIAYGKTTAELVFISKQSGHIVDPMIASGGGVVDVCAFALRLACWTLSRGVAKVIILDEPMKHLSVGLRDSACTMIENLADRLGVQFIIITHMEELEACADKLIQVKLDKEGVSYIK